MATEFAILIVEDDADLAVNLEQVLAVEGYHSVVAHDGQTALALSRKSVFLLGIVDMKLPDMSGLALIDQLAELSPEAEYIIITGYASLETAIEAVEKKRIIAYETKPLNLDHVLSLIRQVAEREQAESKLRESQELYRTSVETFPDLLAMTDLAGNIIYVSRHTLGLYGYENVAEILGRSLLEFIVPEERDRAMVCFRHVLTEGFVRNVEHRLLRKDGSQFIGEINASLVKDADGAPQAVIAIVRDITERRRAEETLRESETFIATVFDSIADFLTVQDIDYNIIKTNEVVEQIFGKDIVGKKCYQVYQGRHEVCPDCPTVKVLNTGKPAFSTEQVSRLGQVVEIWAFPIKDAQGNITAVIEHGRDITGRKQAQAVLKRSEEFFRTVFDSVKDAVSIINVADFTIAGANRAFLELYNLSEEQVIGKTCYQISHHRSEPCVAPDDLCPLEDTVTTGKHSVAEHLHYAQDGTRVYVEVSASPIKDESGQVVQIVHVSRDITKLRQSERLSQTMSDSSPIGIYIVQDGELKLVNPQLLRLTGYGEDEALGKDTLSFVLPEDRDMVRANAVAMLKGERAAPYEFRLVDKAGRVRWVMETLASIQYRGRPATLGNYMDITEHKQAEKALVVQKELTDRILASTPNAVLVVDRDLDIVLVNQTFCQTFRVEKAAVEGKPFTDVSCLGGLTEAVTGALADRQFPPEREFRCEVENREMAMVAQIVPMGAEEVLLLLRDVTAERARQEQLSHLDRLASIGEVAAGIAHELNNPLTGVLGYSELLLSANIPQEVKSDVEVIHNNAQRAVTIVRNLLAFARRQPPQKQRLGLNELVKQVLEMRGYELRVNNIEVIMELADGLPEVMADPRQLEQVFLNIILNAEQAMLKAHQRGHLLVKTEPRRGMVRVSFADDGPGIPPENLMRVFDPFFTTKEPGKGTGLGLSICHGIVTEHGGRIYAASQVGEGATFFVELPVAAAEEKSGLK